jgi:hypothetical protein
LAYIKHGGGIIKRKLLLSVLLLFSLALVFNLNSSSATTVNQTNTTVKQVTTNTTTHTVATTKVVSKPKTVGGLTIAQIKDGLTRAQKFYNTNYRLPSYVTFGSKKVPISNFQKILSKAGLKLKVLSAASGASRPVYITSDNINNPTADNARINSIVKGLRALGIRAYAAGLGPNTHITALKANIPKNALVVDIYGGADAALIKEMTSSWYKSIKGAKKVFTVYWPTSVNITGLKYLVRAHDDNYSPASFKGLAHPDQYLLNNGYKYVYSGCIATIVQAISAQAKI